VDHGAQRQRVGRFQGDLPERTYQFARIIIRIIKTLPHCMEGWVIGKQLARSGTAIGANVCEADVALTDKEFVQFCNIARRETAETRYWLRLCQDELKIVGDELNSALQELDELSRILTTIVQKSRQAQRKVAS
jgi:four helix bundle protein